MVSGGVHKRTGSLAKTRALAHWLTNTLAQKAFSADRPRRLPVLTALRKHLYANAGKGHCACIHYIGPSTNGILHSGFLFPGHLIVGACTMRYTASHFSTLEDYERLATFIRAQFAVPGAASMLRFSKRSSWKLVDARVDACTIAATCICIHALSRSTDA